MKLGEIFRRTAAGLLAGLLLLAAAEIEVGQSETKQKAAGLTFLPDWAAIILAAPWAGTRSEFGFPANELYAVDLKGKKYERLTHNNYLYNHFAVSPDRKMIAAIRYSAGDTNQNGQIDFRDKKTLWILDLENKEEWPLLSEYDTGWGGVDWSPDNQYVYVSIFKDNQSNIYRIHPDGTGLQNITRGIEKTLSPDRPHKWVSDTGVSPDGQWIAFLYSGRRGQGFRSPARNRIAVCRVDGTEARFLTDGGSVKPLAHGPWGPGDFDPEFSPDGKAVSFQRATDVAVNFAAKIPSHDIMRIDIDGTGLKRLSPENNPAVHGISDWSEANRIIFSEWNQQDMYVGAVVVNADGGNYHRLTDLPTGGSHFRWIPRKQ
jgi:Tol biopolymer transport system component